MHLPGLLETGRNAVLQVPKEGLQRREPHVPRADRVAACALEEVEDQLRAEVLDPDPAGADAQPLAGETRQQLEAGSVAVDRMAAGATVPWRVLAKERTDVGSEVRHGNALRACALSASRAICASRAGVASRYRYVSDTLAWPR